MNPVLIVSTGRSGSTMLSEIVRLHPRMLSVSEFFVSFDSRALVGGALGGEAMCRRLTTPSPVFTAMMRSGGRSGDLLYRFGPDARYRPEDLPPVLCSTLPFLSREPERLLDELLAAVEARGEHPLADQYRFVLDWLARRFGKRIWVERSGASIRLVPVLAEWFPDARFVHLCRDGRDAAISMQSHPWARLMLRYMQGLAEVKLDPFAVENAWGADPLATHLERGMAERFSIAEFERERVDVAEAGWLWNGMIERGLEYLGRLAPGRVMTIRFEDLVAAPRKSLGHLVRWIGEDFEDEAWLDAASRIPRPTAPRWVNLDHGERERLAAACAPGLERLGYAGNDVS